MSAASDALADRIRSILGPRPELREQKMFGGMAFMLDGNMVVGVMKTGEMLARVGPDRMDEALTRPGATPMRMGARLMSGFVSVTDDGIEDDEALSDWIAYCEHFVRTLPPK